MSSLRDIIARREAANKQNAREHNTALGAMGLPQHQQQPVAPPQYASSVLSNAPRPPQQSAAQPPTLKRPSPAFFKLPREVIVEIFSYLKLLKPLMPWLSGGGLTKGEAMPRGKLGGRRPISAVQIGAGGEGGGGGYREFRDENSGGGRKRLDPSWDIDNVPISQLRALSQISIRLHPRLYALRSRRQQAGLRSSWPTVGADRTPNPTTTDINNTFHSAAMGADASEATAEGFVDVFAADSDLWLVVLDSLVFVRRYTVVEEVVPIAADGEEAGEREVRSRLVIVKEPVALTHPLRILYLKWAGVTEGDGQPTAFIAGHPLRREQQQGTLRRSTRLALTVSAALQWFAFGCLRRRILLGCTCGEGKVMGVGDEGNALSLVSDAADAYASAHHVLIGALDHCQRYTAGAGGDESVYGFNHPSPERFDDDGSEGLTYQLVPSPLMELIFRRRRLGWAMHSTSSWSSTTRDANSRKLLGVVSVSEACTTVACARGNNEQEEEGVNEERQYCRTFTFIVPCEDLVGVAFQQGFNGAQQRDWSNGGPQRTAAVEIIDLDSLSDDADEDAVTAGSSFSHRLREAVGNVLPKAASPNHRRDPQSRFADIEGNPLFVCIAINVPAITPLFVVAAANTTTAGEEAATTPSAGSKRQRVQKAPATVPARSPVDILRGIVSALDGDEGPPDSAGVGDCHVASLFRQGQQRGCRRNDANISVRGLWRVMSEREGFARRGETIHSAGSAVSASGSSSSPAKCVVVSDFNLFDIPTTDGHGSHEETTPVAFSSAHWEFDRNSWQSSGANMADAANLTAADGAAPTSSRVVSVRHRTLLEYWHLNTHVIKTV